MAKDITKEDYITFLVDVKGYSLDDAEEMFQEKGVKCISTKDTIEFFQFIS